MSEKMRVHILAKELNVPSKIIIEKCRAEGIGSVKNHMSTLSAGLHATICEWFSEGSLDTALETAKPVDLKRVRIKTRKKKAKKAAEESTKPAKEAEVAASAATAVAEAPVEAEVGTVAEAAADAPTAPAEVEIPAEMAEVTNKERVVEIAVSPVKTPALAEPSPAPATEAERAVEPPATGIPETGPAEAPAETIPSAAAAAASAPTAIEAESPDEAKVAGEAPRESVAALPTEPESEVKPETPRPSEPTVPAGPQHVPTPAKLQGPRVVRYEAPDYDIRPPRRPPSGRPLKTTPSDSAPRPQAPTPPMKLDKPGDRGRRRGRINPRRAAGSLKESGERLAEWRDLDLQERKERLAGATGRRIMRHRTAMSTIGAAHPAPAGPKTGATVHEPIRMKEFCSVTGLSFVQLFKVLRSEHNIVANINMTLPTEIAELLALHYGIELAVVPARTRLDDLKDEFAARERKNEQPRPPVVTMLGHVDHGKTSLLDAIRKTRVVVGEDGGITQHISSYHLQTSHGAVTFLDTPGHEAFTAMRARGARITDVVVLVVAADDGVMPQTIEAIHHAQAANVAIVVALNKIDLGDQNKLRIYGQLAEHGLMPSGDWGGDVDVIDTSATTGQGVAELVEHLAALSSLLELKADPTLPATGTVIEAETKPGVGAVARLLIQDGTLRVGDFVTCGNASGKVRALVNDRGERVTRAGPAMPVEVWGLDDVPLSSDILFQVESLQRAKDIAAETRQVRVDASRRQTRKVKSLQEMLQQRDADEIPELNVIIKTDVDGSLAALRQSLSGIPSDEVKLTIRHAGVGGVNDSDILLAATCGGIVVAFRVDASVGARRLSDEHGVEIRSYRVIYDVCDEVKKALEGLLAPLETIESRAVAEVREVFKLSRKAGVIAGSYVTEGTFDRNHFAKIIRDGVVVREGGRIASLRRFKDDVKEVRAGMECGIRIDGFDDIHVGDTIETYEIVKTARTL